MKSKKENIELATFGGGCFWGVEESFRQLKGVVETTVGYMGGSFDKPTYEDICTDETGHAEVVQIKYDPSKISYKELLDIFWSLHNPTTLNRQGLDIGTQYRSVVFFHTNEQENIAKKSKQELEKSGKYKKPIVTEILPASNFIASFGSETFMVAP